jgi:hypothetical protein
LDRRVRVSADADSSVVELVVPDSIVGNLGLGYGTVPNVVRLDRPIGISQCIA